MKTTRTHLFGLFILLITALFMACESNPVEGNSEVMIEPQGVSMDELTMVAWSPEVVRSIRALPEMDESGQILNRRTWGTRPGVDVQEVEFDEGGLVGGETTFGNSVYVPEGALAQDKYIAVQVACSDADLVALFEDGEAYMEMIEADLEGLLENLNSDLEQAETDDDFEYDEDDIEDAIHTIEEALEAIHDNAIYFQLYSYFAQERTFSHMEHDVSRRLKYLAYDIDNGRINPEYYSVIHGVTLLTVEAVREMALSSISYAEQNPEADQNKIDAAWQRVAQGDAIGDWDVSYIDLEWNYYDWAINRYKQAWKFAGQAIQNLDAPCGAMVDFLPSQQFEADVYVTLSWEVLNFDGDPESLDIHWYNEETGLWVLVPNPVIDTEEGTVSVYIDHFTRYAWTVRPPPSEL
jgi:hypothetical protein